MFQIVEKVRKSCSPSKNKKKFICKTADQHASPTCRIPREIYMLKIYYIYCGSLLFL